MSAAVFKGLDAPETTIDRGVYGTVFCYQLV